MTTIAAIASRLAEFASIARAAIRAAAAARIGRQPDAATLAILGVRPADYPTRF